MAPIKRVLTPKMSPNIFQNLPSLWAKISHSKRFGKFCLKGGESSSLKCFPSCIISLRLHKKYQSASCKSLLAVLSSLQLPAGINSSAKLGINFHHSVKVSGFCYLIGRMCGMTLSCHKTSGCSKKSLVSSPNEPHLPID